MSWYPRLHWSKLMLNFLFSTWYFTTSNYVVYWWKRNNHLYPYSWTERLRQSTRHWLIVIDGDSFSLSSRMAGWLLMLGRGGLRVNPPLAGFHGLLSQSRWWCECLLLGATETFVESWVKFGPVPLHSNSPHFKAMGLSKVARLNSLSHQH